MKEIKIPIQESGYYRMFITEESYRESCYGCKYASLDKPADITIGDYFEAKDDYPNLFAGDDAIDCNGGISCAITHNQKGEQLLQSAMEYLFLKEVEPKVVQASHGNLHRPSRHSTARPVLKFLYKIFGYKSIEMVYSIWNKIANKIRR